MTVKEKRGVWLSEINLLYLQYKRNKGYGKNKNKLKF